MPKSERLPKNGLSRGRGATWELLRNKEGQTALGHCFCKHSQGCSSIKGEERGSAAITDPEGTVCDQHRCSPSSTPSSLPQHEAHPLHRAVLGDSGCVFRRSPQVSHQMVHHILSRREEMQQPQGPHTTREDFIDLCAESNVP